MAFATLPYPSMDFVPLDVLTADELDQIVANINAVNTGTVGTSQIADSAITTAKLASSAITEAKIDRSSFIVPKSNGISIQNTTAPTTWTNKTSIDVSSYPTGSHFVVLTTVWARTSTAPSTFSVRSEYNGSYGYVAWTGADDVEGLHSGTSFYTFTKASGKDTVNAQIMALGSYTVSDGHVDIIAIPC